MVCFCFCFCVCGFCFKWFLCVGFRWFFFVSFFCVNRLFSGVQSFLVFGQRIKGWFVGFSNGFRQCF